MKHDESVEDPSLGGGGVGRCCCESAKGDHRETQRDVPRTERRRARRRCESGIKQIDREAETMIRGDSLSRLKVTRNYQIAIPQEIREKLGTEL